MPLEQPSDYPKAALQAHNSLSAPTHFSPVPDTPESQPFWANILLTTSKALVTSSDALVTTSNYMEALHEVWIAFSGSLPCAQTPAEAREALVKVNQ